MTAIPVSFVSACRKFFGMKPGQTLSEFAAEIKALSETDRAWFKREFAKIDIVVE